MDADDLIGTTSPAPGALAHFTAGLEAQAYYGGQPYPRYAFGEQQWPRAKGPFPTPLPYASILVNDGADFLFRGGPPTFAVPAKAGAKRSAKTADDFLQNVIKHNRLGARWAGLAQQNGNQGTVAVKFSYDVDRPGCAVKVSFLSCPQECRVWCDPHDVTRVLMARVQYPYREADGSWWYFREEWTDDLWVTYYPKRAGEANLDGALTLPGYLENLGDGDDWVESDMVDNPFGLIPITLIVNKAREGSPLGTGDTWGNFRLIDRLALTLHGQDRHNQLHTEPIPVTTNASVQDDGPTVPGQPVNVQNSDANGPAADFKLLEVSGSARQFVREYAQDMESLLYKNAGLSLIDPAQITNKGAMTDVVFRMVYARSIATSDRKRTHWGDDGLCVFWQNMLVGLKRNGGVPEVAGVPDDVDVTCTWPDYFAATPDDVANTTTRTLDQVDAGVLSKSRAAKRLAAAEGIPSDEHDAVVAELALDGANDTPPVRKRKRVDAKTTAKAAETADDLQNPNGSDTK